MLRRGAAAPPTIETPSSRTKAEAARRTPRGKGSSGSSRPAPGDPRVGDAGDAAAIVAAQVPDVGGHPLGAGRAVQPDREDGERLDGGQGGGDVGPHQHRPGALDREGDHHRNVPLHPFERLETGDQRDLDLQQVLARLDDQQVRSGLDERPRLLGEGGRHRLEGDVSQRRELVVGPMEPATYAGPPCRRIASRAFPTAARLISATRSASPYSARTIALAPKVFVSSTVAPGGEEGGMPLPDHLGSGNVQEFVAPVPSLPGGRGISIRCRFVPQAPSKNRIFASRIAIALPSVSAQS